MQVFFVLACIFAVVYGQNNSTNPCDGVGDDLVSDPQCCGMFYQCTCDGRSFQMTCPPGLEFNAKLRVCDWPYRANCTTGGNGGEGGVVTPPPSGVTAPCVSTEAATLTYPNDCQKYYYCYKGFPFVVQCDDGEYFSENAHSCIKTDKCPGDGGGTGGGTGGGNGGETDFTCPAEFGTYPYPDDETRYYYCYNKILYIVQCYANQKYDPSVNACEPSQ